MKVVMVVAIPVWADDALEQIAGAAMDLTQEGFLAAPGVPVMPDRNRLSVRHLEAGNIDCIGQRMLTARTGLAIVPVAASIGAPVIYARNGLAEMSFRGRLQYIFFKDREGRCQLAAGLEALVKAD